MVNAFNARLIVAVIAASTALGCNDLLDIEAAELDRVDAALSSDAQPESGSGGSGGSVEGGPQPGCTLTGKPCQDCVASSCCNEYQACLDNPACNAALVDYSYCIFQNAASGGLSCAEIFSNAAVVQAKPLVQCAFTGACGTQCNKQLLRPSCEAFCQCFSTACSGIVPESAQCAGTCSSLSDEQLTCRSWHCPFAKTEPQVHCSHSAGPPVCP